MCWSEDWDAQAFATQRACPRPSGWARRAPRSEPRCAPTARRWCSSRRRRKNRPAARCGERCTRQLSSSGEKCSRFETGTPTRVTMRAYQLQLVFFTTTAQKAVGGAMRGTVYPAPQARRDPAGLKPRLDPAAHRYVPAGVNNRAAATPQAATPSSTCRSAATASASRLRSTRSVRRACVKR